MRPLSIDGGMTMCFFWTTIKQTLSAQFMVLSFLDNAPGCLTSDELIDHIVIPNLTIQSEER